jgi:chromosomal replication initiation ATPase DnaA
VVQIGYIKKNNIMIDARISPYIFPGLRLNELLKIRSEEKKKTQLKDVLRAASNYFQIPEYVFLSKDRTEEVSDMRKVFCYITHVLLKMSKTSIGKFINRDHTTVISNIYGAQDLMETNDEFAKDVYTLSALVIK